MTDEALVKMENSPGTRRLRSCQDGFAPSAPTAGYPHGAGQAPSFQTPHQTREETRAIHKPATARPRQTSKKSGLFSPCRRVDRCYVAAR